MPFAIVDRSRSGIESVLMILDERAEADAIAFELRRRHLDVRVVEFDERGRPDDDPDPIAI